MTAAILISAVFVVVVLAVSHIIRLMRGGGQ